ncbi:MAG: CoA-binding protein [Hyphomicrobium sp.]
MGPRLTFVTLGVVDLQRSRAFYEALGFSASRASQAGVVFIDAGGVVLSLFGRGALAEDAQVHDSHPGFSGIALAHNTASKQAVDRLLARAVEAGARLLKPAQKVFWGGYAGYFADPDGHLWEVAYNPFMALAEDGRVLLPEAENHDAYSDHHIETVLKSARSVAVVGASAKALRPSYEVMEFLLQRGYRVVPVNPGQVGGTILGQHVYARLADVPGPIDFVDVFRKSDAAGDVLRQAIAEKDRLGLKVVWMQLGVRNDTAAREAEAAGLTVIMNRCPKIEYARLGLEALSRN